MSQGIKISNKSNNVTFEFDWISGVDYDEESFENEKWDAEEEDTNNEKTTSKIRNMMKWMRTN